MLRRVLFEFVQNAPVVAGFVAGVWLWERSQPVAIVCLVAGSAATAIAIALTEGRKTGSAQYREPVGVLALNMVVMSALAVLLAAYIRAAWSGWMWDVTLGALAGAGLAVGQDVAARARRVEWRHVVALALAVPVSLVGLRGLIQAQPVIAAVVVSIAVSLVIGVAEHRIPVEAGAVGSDSCALES